MKLKYGLGIATSLDNFFPDEIGSGQVKCNSKFVSKTGEKLFSLIPENQFTSLHKKNAEILSLKIPDNTILKEPIIIRKTQDSAFFEHTIIEVGKNCSLSVIETLEGSGYHSGGLELFLGEGSKLVFGSSQLLSKESNNFSIKKAFLEKDSYLEIVTADIGSNKTISHITGDLAGQGASLDTKALMFGSGDQHFDFNITSTHSAPHTQSNITQKAVLDDRSKLILNGLVRINQNAPGSNGYQKEDTLLLSPEAEAAPIPSLEIENNDVRCSHGTSVGQIDKDMLFYSQSRGLSEEKATHMAVKGFFEPLISSLPMPSLQEALRKEIKKKLEEGL